MDKISRILIACEESGAVTDAFIELGFTNVWSCDLMPCSGKNPNYHLQPDVVPLLKENWDMMIAFPPCTYLTVTANRSFLSNPERWKKRFEAVMFVWELYNAPINKIAIENPKGVLSTHIRKPDQYIQPYEYGHPLSKLTGLWLKNLQPLQPTNIVAPEWIYPKSGSGKRMSKLHANNPSTNNKNNSKLRSKTFPGIAKAMAEQWGNEV